MGMEASEISKELGEINFALCCWRKEEKVVEV